MNIFIAANVFSSCAAQAAYWCKAFRNWCFINCHPLIQYATEANYLQSCTVHPLINDLKWNIQPRYWHYVYIKTLFKWSPTLNTRIHYVCHVTSFSQSANKTKAVCNVIGWFCQQTGHSDVRIVSWEYWPEYGGKLWLLSIYRSAI